MSIFSDYTEGHSRPADDGAGPWTAAERPRPAAGLAEAAATATVGV